MLGVVVNWVVLEVCVKVCNEGCDFVWEGNEIICEVCKWSLELVVVCEVWKEIVFNFVVVDVLDK